MATSSSSFSAISIHVDTAQTSADVIHAISNGHIEKKHVCENCGKAFPYLSILESHKRCHTGEKPFNCHFCDKKFAQKATLQVHERTHTGERPYKCKYCEKTFAQYGTKTVHEKSAHLGIRNYKCPSCNKCLSSPSALYTHKKTHGEKTLQCSYCPKTFTLKNYLKLHVKQVHEQSDRRHACIFCNKSFAYAGSLQVHIRTHTGERPYICNFCPKAFASQGNLQSHERTHTGERPYTCVKCGRSFIQKSQLSAHEATHQYQPTVSPEGTSQKKTTDHICKYCGKKYAYASSLYVHTRLHTGERPFRCSFCNKTFTNQGNMQVHLRVHTGEKPYKCYACDKSYAQKVGLKIHMEQCTQYLTGQQTNPVKQFDKSNQLDSFASKCPGALVSDSTGVQSFAAADDVKAQMECEMIATPKATLAPGSGVQSMNVACVEMMINQLFESGNHQAASKGCAGDGLGTQALSLEHILPASTLTQMQLLLHRQQQLQMMLNCPEQMRTTGAAQHQAQQPHQYEHQNQHQNQHQQPLTMSFPSSFSIPTSNNIFNQFVPKQLQSPSHFSPIPSNLQQFIMPSTVKDEPPMYA